MGLYAIVLTGSFGDVINATPIAAQLKKQSPDNKIHWYVSSRCQTALIGNYHIDKVIVIPGDTKPSSTIPATQKAIKIAREKAIYEKIIAPAPYYRPFWNTQKLTIIDCIRKAAEQDLGISKWDVPWRPTLNLTKDEVERAQRWVSKLPKKRKVLFEHQAESGQSYLKQEWIVPICKAFGDKWVVILSGKKPGFKLPRNAVDGSVLSIRETAEVFKHVDAMVGVASGITCVCSSSWTDGVNVPWVESCNNKLWSGENFPNKPHSICYSNSLSKFLELVERIKNGS